MNYNFVEIGTANFDTLIEQATETTLGISVEPLIDYLNQLPNPPGVKKVNCAINTGGNDTFIKIYFIPEKIINKKKLGPWLRGCNSINDYHPQHIKLNLTEFVKTRMVPSISIEKLFKTYNVEKLDHLKLDTEGLDADILISFIPYLLSVEKEKYPKQITFESNSLTSQEKIQNVIREYLKLGYKITSQGPSQDNIIMNLE